MWEEEEYKPLNEVKFVGTAKRLEMNGKILTAEEVIRRGQLLDEWEKSSIFADIRKDVSIFDEVSK